MNRCIVLCYRMFIYKMGKTINDNNNNNSNLNCACLVLDFCYKTDPLILVVKNFVIF